MLIPKDHLNKLHRLMIVLSGCNRDGLLNKTRPRVDEFLNVSMTRLLDQLNLFIKFPVALETDARLILEKSTAYSEKEELALLFKQCHVLI